MKAVILNTEKKHTNILCNDGSFRKIKRQSWHTAGKEFDYVPSSTSVVSKAAVILIAVLLTSLISAYALPYRTLALDINPSVTMSINRFGYVINAYGTDESGIKLVHNRKLIHKKVENALGLLVTEATAEGYLKPETDNVVLLSYNVPSEINYNRETDYIDKLVRTFEETTTRLNIPAQIVTQPIDTEIMEQAKANDVSPGRMALLNKLKEVDQDVTLEDIKDGPVKDIISAIQSNDKDYFMAKEAFADSETEKTPKGKNDENENNKDNKNNNKDNKSNVENNSKNNKKEAKKAKKEGRIRFISITNHTADIAKEAIATGYYDTLQYPFSSISSQGDYEITLMCKEQNMGFIAMKALCGGLIADVEAAFAFLWQYDHVVPIWGIQKEEELDQFLSLSKNPPAYDDEMKRRVEKDREELAGSFCRSCGYCLPCAVGIDIPQAARMKFLLRRAPYRQFLTDEWNEKMHKIEECIECYECSERCPYHLDTPRLLKDMLEDYKEFSAKHR
jgi:ferredoxin